MNPNIESRFEKRLLRCPTCNRPLAQLRGDEIHLVKYLKGKTMYTKVEVNHDAGGRLKVSCDCGGSFATTVKTLRLTYAIATPRRIDIDS